MEWNTQVGCWYKTGFIYKYNLWNNTVSSLFKKVSFWLMTKSFRSQNFKLSETYSQCVFNQIIFFFKFFVKSSFFSLNFHEKRGYSPLFSPSSSGHPTNFHIFFLGFWVLFSCWLWALVCLDESSLANMALILVILYGQHLIIALQDRLTCRSSTKPSSTHFPELRRRNQMYRLFGSRNRHTSTFCRSRFWMIFRDWMAYWLITATLWQQLQTIFSVKTSKCFSTWIF